MGWSLRWAPRSHDHDDHLEAAAGARVDAWIRTHRSIHPAPAAWTSDQAHLGGHTIDGDLAAASPGAAMCVVTSVIPLTRSIFVM